MKNEPIIIIGAGRSGTNILRDSICTVNGFKTWPCDEINYVWRHGNIRKDTDRFTAQDVTPEIKKYIQNQFENFEKTSGAEYIVEKTCANSLKVPFINEIFPKAKYIFLIREGNDVASSAQQRWTASLELKYIWKKVRYVPITDIPYYGFRYFMNRLKKVFSEEKRLAFWGPLYPKMMDDLQNHSLIEVCANQWASCVKTAYGDLSSIDSKQIHFMKYEEFVQNPQIEIKKVFDFLNVKVNQGQIEKSVNNVSARSIGNYKKYISEVDLKKIDITIKPVMDSVYHKI